MRRRTLLKCAGLLALMGAPALRAEPEPIARQLRFTVNATNPFQHALGRQVIWVYLPVSLAPTQKLVDVEVSVPYKVLNDRWGHTIAELEFENLPPLATRVVALRLDVEMKASPELWPLAEGQDWLRAERYIESTSPAIVSLAARLRRGTPMETARSIYEWVADNIQYPGYVAEDRGALDALERRSGDCTEYAYLVVALARACGIPARAVGGYVINGSAAPKAQEFHDWAELYVDGTWRVVDAQKRNWLSPAENFVVFRIYREDLDNPLGRAHRFRVEGEARVTM